MPSRFVIALSGSVSAPARVAGLRQGDRSARNGFLLRERPFPEARNLHDHEVPLDFPAGLDQSDKLLSGRVGTIGLQPEKNYRRWGGESARVDQFAVVAIKRDDPTLFGHRQREYCGILGTPATFGD